MAERIDYDVKPTKIGPDAHEELERLLQTLHEHGALRLANDLVGANPQIAKVLVDGLAKPGSLNAAQNLSILLMALSRIEPAQFYRVVFAIKDGLNGVGSYAPPGGLEEGAPGLSGAYKLLQDDDLWHALMPLLAGLKAFASGLDRKVEKPISAFTGKPSNS
ncbi:DUF1641 domain-containing protein [Consotaella salsifontis]|uniref:Uncharacterized conserved protein YjgD, DUF1641 family n=1 Tax=Consotaella salsifontis TaxID=1365950 RepID=A0A1T4RB67_9HYPH|nr:DUF1641 domain-containing protein [Consotaella salsifontis]SKA12948.1 Uncharacterized conserved protein YjgD, DUF1641 family [Consotaella salsifontis]